MSEETFIEAVKVLRDDLSKLSEELKATITLIDTILEKRTPAKPESVENLIDKTGEKLLAEIILNDDTVTITTVQKLQVKANDPALRRFLLPSVLDKLKKKHGVEYYVETKGELLHRIVLKNMPEGEWERIEGAVRWTFEKAHERMST